MEKSCRSTRRKYRKEIGAPRLAGEKRFHRVRAVSGAGDLEVNGLLAGFTGEGAKTVIPAVAMAKVSMRLVPDQDPDTIAGLFEAYVRKITPKTVELKVTRMHGGKPWMAAFDNAFVRAAGRAIERGFGKPPVFNREGGSIPVVSTFQEELGLPSVLPASAFGRECPRAERKADMENFHKGIHCIGFLIRRLQRWRSRREKGALGVDARS